MRFLATFFVFIVSGLAGCVTAYTSTGTSLGSSLYSLSECTRLESVEVYPQTLDLTELTDVRELYKALQALAAPKDEFETTAQYEDRMTRLYQETRIGGRALIDTFMVMAPINRYFFHYDADRQIVRVEHMLGISNVPFGMQYPTGKVPAHSAYEDRFNRDIRVLDLEREVEKGESYEASNAYGRKVTVEVSSTTEYNLVMMNVNGNVNCDGQHVQFQVLPAVARDLQDNLAAVVKFDLRRPYAVESSFYVEPKIDNPREIYSTEYNIIGRALEIYLINRNTGQVLGAYLPR